MILPLTTVEVAARFAVDPRTVARWANTGVIAAHRTTGQWLFDPAVVDTFVPPQLRPAALGCKVPGCDEPHEALGWCGAHYKRLRTRGDVFADVPVGQLRHGQGRIQPARMFDAVDTGEL